MARTTNARIAGVTFLPNIAVGVAGLIASGAATRSARRRMSGARIAHTLTGLVQRLSGERRRP